jgi:hypothetical protein
MSLLDMLTCCLGAILVLWIASSAMIRSSKGIAPGTVITFKVTSDLKGTIGVRVKMKDGIRWAGDTSPTSNPIVIEPGEEGEKDEVTLVLTGDYTDEDQCFVFVHQLDGGVSWPSGKVLTVEVEGSKASINPLLFKSDQLFHQLSLKALREGTNNP